MRFFQTGLLLGLLALACACGEEEDFQDAAAGDVTPSADAGPDAAWPDLAPAADLTPDAAPLDAPLPDAAMPDQPTPPDAPPVDLAPPDQAVPPDAPNPDLSPPPDVSPPPDQTLPDSGTPDTGPPPLAILDHSFPEGRIGKKLVTTLKASGGTPPYSWMLVPLKHPWLSISNSGVLQGTPLQSGQVSMTVKVADSGGKHAQRAFQIQVVHVILLSAFGPFKGYPVNPSWEAIKTLAGLRLGDHEVRTVKLPVEWIKGTKLFLDAVDEHRPVIIVSAGVAGNLNKMRLESTARNKQVGKDVQGHLDISNVRHHDVYMRTTLTLDSDVAVRLKDLAERQKTSFKQTVNDVLRRGLMAQDLTRRRRPKYRVKTFNSALRPGVDPLKLNQLVDELEARRAAEQPPRYRK